MAADVLDKTFAEIEQKVKSSQLNRQGEEKFPPVSGDGYV